MFSEEELVTNLITETALLTALLFWNIKTHENDPRKKEKHIYDTSHLIFHF